MSHIQDQLAMSHMASLEGKLEVANNRIHALLTENTHLKEDNASLRQALHELQDIIRDLNRPTINNKSDIPSGFLR